MSLETLDKSIIEAMRYFVSVVELGTLTAVKDLYKIEINTLKSKLRQLEDYIGVNLLVNNKNRITITNKGMIFYQKCNKILFDLEAMIVNVRDRGVNFSESLSVIGTDNFIELFISYLLPKLGEYLDKYTFNFDSYTLSQYEYINQLDNYDIALIRSDYIDKIDQNKWIVCNYIEHQSNDFRAYASETFLKENDLSSLEKILEAPFIARKESFENLRISYDKGDKQRDDIVLKNIKFVVENDRTIVRLIKKNMGIGILDNSVLAAMDLEYINIKPVDGAYSKLKFPDQCVIVSKYLPSSLIKIIRGNIKFNLNALKVMS
ncbi:LysR family transcriptional regulator [Francisella salina]|uniref:LysR family transcriptional regulator n=1 Tax=Francisella salina TaxID=573569 RepID=A0ABN3ZQJ6_FRAST|nr:LysR family transcriptional regulator [Francisella salina]AEI36815.1 putative LysR family transcriptional regulator [Francisella salina]